MEKTALTVLLRFQALHGILQSFSNLVSPFLVDATCTTDASGETEENEENVDNVDKKKNLNASIL